MVLGIFKSIAKFGKKAFTFAKKVGGKIIHEIPKVVDFARRKVAPIVGDVAKVVGNVAQSAVAPLVLFQPELAPIAEGIAVGAKGVQGISKSIEIPKKAGARPKPDNPMVMREVAPPPPNPQQTPAPDRPNPFIKRGGISGIRMA